MSAEAARAWSAERWAALAGLAAAAVALNVFAPTVFFDVQIMLGASLGVYALLACGWPGLVVGIAALVVTLVRWRHPFELLIGTGHLVWLAVFLDRCNGGAARRDNGRIVLASIAYWVAVGLPCELLHFTRYFGLDLVKAAGLGLKECVTGVLNASLGLVLYQCTLALRAGGGRAVSARGATFATVLVAVTLPGIVMTMLVSRHLRAAALESHLVRLQQAAAPAVARLVAGEPALPGGGEGDAPIAVQARAADGTVHCSDPELFRRLAADFEIELPNRTGVPGLDIYAPRASIPAARAEQVCFWVTALDAPPGWSAARAVQPAPPLIRILDHKLLLPLFAALFGLQVCAAGIAETIASFVDRQFRTVLAPARRPAAGATMPDLDAAAIAELDELVSLVNAHARRVNDLSASLETARQHEQVAESQRRAELQRKLKTSLSAAAIAHEINLPLSNIVLGSKVAAEALEALGRDGEPLRPILAGLVRESEQVVATIERMRLLLRSVQTELAPVDVANVVHNAVLHAERDLERHGVALEVRGAECPCIVEGDAGQLQIALANLLRNAIDAVAAGPADGRRIDVEIVRRPATAAGTGVVEVAVGDSGPGISDPATIGEPLESTKPDGTGLGLYVVRTIVENHGGELRVVRSPLGGAEFRITLTPARG